MDNFEDKPTVKQIELIEDMQRTLGVPEFKGTTRKEACGYIGRYWKRYRLSIGKYVRSGGDVLYAWRR